jgi:hypothetical protein
MTYRGSSWETSLDLGISLPTGQLDTPLMPKFGKVYKAFEHLFNLKRGFDAHVWVVLLLGVAYLAWFT